MFEEILMTCHSKRIRVDNVLWLPSDNLNSSNDEPALLQDVLHVPRISANLLSVYRITKQDYGVYFDSSVLEVIDTNSLQIVASGTQEGGLYHLKSSHSPLGQIQISSS